MGLIITEQVGRFATKKLTKAGAKVLRDYWDSEEIAGVIRKLSHQRSPYFAPHYIATHDALIAFEAAGYFAGLDVADFKDEDWIRSEWTGLLPDGYIHLTDGYTELCALIEVERTSKVKGLSPAAFVKKVPRYIELMHQRGQFPTQPIVFTFCTTWARAESLRTETQDERVGGRSNFWFGTIDMLANPTEFFDYEFLVATAKPRTIRAKLAS